MYYCFGCERTFPSEECLMEFDDGYDGMVVTIPICPNCDCEDMMLTDSDDPFGNDSHYAIDYYPDYPPVDLSPMRICDCEDYPLCGHI